MAEQAYLKNPHLNGDDIFFPGNKTGLLLIHGFTATTAEVRLLAERLHQAGYTVAAPLLPGHNTHPDDLNRATWQMWYEKVNQTYKTLIANCDRVFVGGESMGALLAIELAAQHPEITRLFLFAPAIKIKKLWLSRFLALFKPYLPKSMKEDGLPWKGYTVYPLKASVEMLKLQKHARRQLRHITMPTLVFTGVYDKTIAPDSADIVLKGINSQHKQHIELENSGHIILLDQDLDKVGDKILKMMNAKL